MRRLSRSAFVAGASAAGAAIALRARAFADDPPAPENPPAGARSVVTHDRVRLRDGSLLDYTATASTIVLHDAHDAPTASMFSTAYTTGDRTRPVTFCYNGGPGSSSVWLHLGAFGPRKIVTSRTSLAPPVPYRLDDNPHTLLDQTDLVFVDPVGTGYSTLAGKATTKDFWGIDEDLRSFGQFIERWRIANDRTTCPTYLIGESYGTFRSAGLADRLQKQGVHVNGVTLISTVLDFADVFGSDGTSEVLADAFAIPTEAAVAFYHGKVAAPDVATAMARARAFAADTYLPAMLRAAPPDEATRARLAEQLHDIVGLDATLVRQSNLRVPKERFEAGLLRADGRVIGRYDGRATGVAIDHGSSEPDFDPSYESVAPAFTALISAYASTSLKWHADRPYRVLPDDISGAWNYRRDGGGALQGAPSVIGDLREAMHTNPALRVFSANGIYDLATPFYGTEVELASVGSDPSVARRITFGFYPSGHMIYLDDGALAALRTDLAAFYRDAGERE